MKKLIKEGAIRDYEMTYKTKSGEKIPVSFSGSVMRDKEGELVGIARDMREIKKKADELNNAYIHLREKTQRLERFHKITVGRELEMVRLKEEINILLERSRQPKKYEAPEKIKKQDKAS